MTLSIVPLCIDISARMIDKCLPDGLGFYVFLIELRVINTLPKNKKKTRFIYCGFQGDEALCWVIIGQQYLLLGGTESV